MKLRLLSQFETVPEEVKELANAVKARYGFTTDYIGTNGDNFSDLHSFEKIKNDLGLECGESLVLKNGKILVLTYGAQRNEAPISQERQINMTPILLQELKEYYEKYYLVDSARIDDLTEMYSMVKKYAARTCGLYGDTRSTFIFKTRIAL